jgi:hypothetical protein
MPSSINIERVGIEWEKWRLGRVGGSVGNYVNVIHGRAVHFRARLLQSFFNTSFFHHY